MTISPGEIIEILLAVLVGGIIGLERELHHKAAGFRTITLICIGATVITILDAHLAASGRGVAKIVTGIGFLGAGVILHDTSRVKGLTTAATIWVAAGLGIAIGSGAYLLAIIATIVVLVVMDMFIRLERRIEKLWDVRRYHIVLEVNSEKVGQLDALLQSSGMHVDLYQQMKVAGQLHCTWYVSGTSEKQNAFVQAVINDPEIKEIKW